MLTKCSNFEGWHSTRNLIQTHLKNGMYAFAITCMIHKDLDLKITLFKLNYSQTTENICSSKKPKIDHLFSNIHEQTKHIVER